MRFGPNPERWAAWLAREADWIERRLKPTVLEARSGDEAASDWGPAAERGPAWEAVTACDLLQGGADILVMRHPTAVEAVRAAVKQLAGV